MIKEVTAPYHSPSRAVVLARERAKRRQGCMWVGLSSVERTNIRSVETFMVVEGNTCCTVLVRYRKAPRRPRAHARMYVQGRDLGGLLAAQRYGRGRQSQGRSRAEDERREEVRCGNNSYEAGEQNVEDHVAELVERRAAPEGKSGDPAYPGHRAGRGVTYPHAPDTVPGMRVPGGWTDYGWERACQLPNVMRVGATRGRSRMR